MPNIISTKTWIEIGGEKQDKQTIIINKGETTIIKRESGFGVKNKDKWLLFEGIKSKIE